MLVKNPAVDIVNLHLDTSRSWLPRLHDDNVLRLQFGWLDYLDLLRRPVDNSLRVDDRLETENVLSEGRKFEGNLVETGLGETQQLMHVEVAQVVHAIAETLVDSRLAGKVVDLES